MILKFGDDNLGKFAKIDFIIGIILMLSLGVLSAIVIPTRSKVLWISKASNINTNNTVTLEIDTYIFGGSYTFNYVEEGTMVISVLIIRSMNTHRKMYSGTILLAEAIRCSTCWRWTGEEAMQP